MKSGRRLDGPRDGAANRDNSGAPLVAQTPMCDKSVPHHTCPRRWRWRRPTQECTGPTRARIEERTLRADRWWLAPLATFVVFTRVRRLRDRPGVHGPRLLRLAVPLAVLLALPRRLRRGRLGLRAAVRVVPAVGGADHPDLPAGLPDDLLLLPQGLLPGVLALAARVRGRGAAQGLLRRDPVPADPAERPPLLLVRRDPGRPGAHLRHGAGLPQRGRASGATWASARC